MKKHYLLFVFSALYAAFSTAQAPGNALQFNASNGYVTASLPTVFNSISANNFTFETWINPDGSGGTRRPFSAQLDASNFVSILLNATNTPYVYIYEGGTPHSLSLSASLPANQWSHFAFTWNAATDGITAYINGVEVSGVSGGSSSTGTNNVMAIGARSDGSQKMGGMLDELRIWDDLRTPCEIVASMNSEFTLTQPNLVVYYNFNHGVAGGTNTTETTLSEFNGNYNGTLSGFLLNGTTSNWVASGADITAVNSNAAVTYIDDVVEACGSYQWIDGVTYNASNTTATHSVIGTNGCEEIYQLDLTINQPSTGTDVISACESYTWINGVEYTASNNSATFNLTNAAGCDSVVTLDLTIEESTSGTDVVSSCDSYTWMDGITYTASNNSATYTLTNAAGCDSVVTLDLTINTVDASATMNAPSFMANTSGASYQWIDCGNGNQVINGETNQTFVATSNGSYAVIVTENGCSDTSACMILDNIGVSELHHTSFVLYPNPNDGHFTLAFATLPQSETLHIIDACGKVVYAERLYAKEQHLAPLLSNGYYILRIGDQAVPFVIR